MRYFNTCAELFGGVCSRSTAERGDAAGCNQQIYPTAG